MRWPFGRKGTGPAPAPEPATSQDGPQAVAAARPSREWATLPPLPITVSRTAPLVIGPAPVLPPLPGRRRATSTPRAPPAGRVDGGATVPPPRPTRTTVESSATAPVPVAPPVVHRPARPLPAEVRSLTDAVDEYVGEPRVAAEPYRAPAWLRHTPSWLEQGGLPDLAAMAGVPILPSDPGPSMPAMITPPSFIPADVSSTLAPPPVSVALPPPVQEVAPTRPAQEPTVLKRRRANLADSRRLGLGSPTSRPGHEPFVLPSQQELVLPPAPEPPAPEPEPEPEPVVEPAVVVEPVVVEEEPPPPEPEKPEPVKPVPPPPVAPRPPIAEDRPEPARVVKPTYRTTPAPKPPPRKKLQQAVVVTKPPAHLVDALRATQRADVADVPVYRGPKVSEAAKARGARAFAAGGAVFLPDEAGPTDSPQTRGLLAHELVHAVPQRTLGGKLPSLSTSEGQALEAEAVAAERWYAGESGAPEPAPLIHAPQPAAAPAPTHVSEVDMSSAAQLAPLAPAAPASPPAQAQPSTLHSPFDESTRQAVGEIAETKARTVVEQWTNPALGGSGFSGGSTGSGGAKSKVSTPGGKKSAGSGDGFDPVARREQLVADHLAIMNASRVGQAELTELPPEVEERIDEQLRRESEQHGVSLPEDEPEKPLSTGQRWVRAFGGDYHESAYNPVAGFKAEVGSEESWFASTDPKEERDAAHISATLGLTSHDQNSTNWHDWMQGSDDEQTQPQGDAGKNGPSRMWTQAERQAHGRPSQEEHPFNLDQLDMEELTARLYDRLRSRMRMELLVDRERSGRLTDFR